MESKNIIIAVLCLINIVIITSKFFVSKRVNNDETKLYGYLLIAMLFESISGIVLFITMQSDQQTINIFNGIYLSTMTIWALFFSLYMIRISEPDDKKYSIIKKIFIMLSLITVVCAITLPRNISISDKNEFYATGPAILSVYMFSGICLLIVGYYLIKNIKKINDKRYIPVFVLLASGFILMMIQSIMPELFLFTPVESYIIFIMYFTIENPDLKMLRQVELAKDQAEKANRAKSDFLSSMSHEIRTPLNAIVGLSEDNLSYKDQLPPDVIENSEDIMSASQTLLEIVGNILDINKIEANKMEIVEAPYNFKEEIENLAKIDATRIGEKPIDFKVNIAEDIPYELLGDKIHMKEIVNNLLTNAIKYTDQGTIELSARCINKGDISNLIISVKDTGKGIKADHINRLFNKFDRLDVELNTTTEGTGLGLAITKALVEMMGGKINVQSQFGNGSIFMVQVPQKISKLSGPIQVVEQSKVESAIQSSVEPIKPIVESNLIGTVQEQQKSNIQNTSSIYGNKKILIADDNKLNIKVARKALQDFNFEIDECYDGLECVEKVKIGNEYDLILMDIMMPNMSGESALKKLKENPNFNIPTIALTADAVSGAEEKYKSEGFIDYIAKPFKKEQIKEKLDMIFSKSISNDENITTNNTEINNNEDVIYDMEPNNGMVSSEEKINVSDSMLVDALSDMSKPLNEIDVRDNVSEDVHVIGEDDLKNETDQY